MFNTSEKLRVLVVGCGNMGAAHAFSYHNLEEFKIVGLVSRNDSNAVLNARLGNKYSLFNDFEKALVSQQPDVVCIATYPDTHEQYTIRALEQGCHVFVEKPIADSVEGAERIREAVKKYKRKLAVGYILRHHPSWIRFIELARELGKPLVMRMNLNQQSHGHMWSVHRNLMKTLSPIVDCGVHYIDVMCQMTNSRPVQVSAIGARLSEDVPVNNYNYGQLQIKFEDGSVGWYESGWGPMISKTAYFVKDVIGPFGSVSIVAKEGDGSPETDSVEGHTRTESLLVHYAGLDQKDNFVMKDTWLNMEDEPDHQELCNRQQQFFLDAIRQNKDLLPHLEDAVNSLRVALACDKSVATGQVVSLK